MNNKYRIHPDFEKFPRLTLGFHPIVVALLNLLMRLQRLFALRSSGVTVKEYPIRRSDGSELKLITMRPPGIQRGAPALIYYHGGAFALSYGGLHLKNCAHYAEQAGCVVIFVDYRLALGHPFPASFDDCYNALIWTVEQSDMLGIDSRRIAVGGDSAGGALAAGVAQKARDEGVDSICAQLLIYPVLDHTCSTESARQFDDVPVFNAIANRRMWEMYLDAPPGQAAPDYAAPGHGKVEGLPFSYVETAEFDPLRDEGLSYATVLKEAGIELQLNETVGTVHGYDAAPRSTLTARALQSRSEFLRKAFGG